LFALVRASAFLIAESPPARVHITVRVRENAFSVTTAILPIALVLPLAIVDHIADSMFTILFPLTIVLVPIASVTIDSSALTYTIKEVSLVYVSVGVASCGLTSVATRH